MRKNKTLYLYKHWVSQNYGEVGDITRIKIRLATHARKSLRSAISGVVHKSIGGNRPAFSKSSSMERFTNTGMADMHLVYGLTEGNTRAAERYPQRGAPEFVSLRIITRQ
ncbi:hypothetical protein TNCV_226261 [Trichonephila clavipes]|nr:hypothetical protein TNCV_226261 [Trichonephila clavipes]